ncbi:MAG: MBL fold metallo-hydrolase [Burkholderiaceae bacterium]
MFRFTSLSSGSQGNALVVQTYDATFMVDCGLGLRDVEERLARRQLTTRDLDFILVTHEHADHVGGVSKLARAADCPVLASHGTLAAMGADHWKNVTTHVFSPHRPLGLQGLDIHPIVVPHDAREPIAVEVVFRGRRFAMVTDLGCATSHLLARLKGLDALVLEFNHDREMLLNGSYPPSLKTRVGGRSGHLSNQEAAAILSQTVSDSLQVVVAAHLSQQNNSPDLVEPLLTQYLPVATQRFIANQDEGFDWVVIQ